jgi:CelD/BcsL family acetyltransferase involved in cellulose biosynthesis
VIEIARLGPDEDERDAWDQFVADVAGGLVYHSLPYRDLLVEEVGCEPEYLVAREDGTIRGVLPLMWSGDEDGRVLNSLPFYGSHGGPVAADPETLAALMEAWNTRATAAGTLAATMVENPFLDLESPSPVHTMTDERISHVTPLAEGAGEEEIMALIASEARRNVRKARRLGVSVERDPDALPELYPIHEENMRAAGGPPKSRKFFEALPRHLRPGREFDFWIARLDGRTIAGLLVLRFGQVAEYFTSGTEHEHRTVNPHAALLITAMSELAAEGIREWNWGGTQAHQIGVYRFKQKWGAAEGSYRYFVNVNDDGLLDSAPEEIVARFPHFYVVPFSALREKGGSASQRS